MPNRKTTVELEESAAEALQQLKSYAESQGMPLGAYLRLLVLQNVGSSTHQRIEQFARSFVNQEAVAGENGGPASAKQWSAAWHAWAAGHPARATPADDSRDSIYGDRDP